MHFSEEQYVALKTMHRSGGSAPLGRDLRQMGIGTNLRRARVWTNSFTVAEHIQPEAIAIEGPLHSEELFHLLKTVIQGEALGHALQFAQRLRDTADEELVTLLENFVTAACRGSAQNGGPFRHLGSQEAGRLRIWNQVLRKLVVPSHLGRHQTSERWQAETQLCRDVVRSIAKERTHSSRKTQAGCPKFSQM